MSCQIQLLFQRNESYVIACVSDLHSICITPWERSIEFPKPKELNPAQSTYITGSYTSMDIIENSKLQRQQGENQTMPIKLSTTVSKISLIRNSTNQMLVREFYDFMKRNGCSEKHINNNLKAIMNFDGSLDSKTSFLEIQRRDQILIFLDSKRKST